jgi:glycosyltransferase involved in cell wall biosynthesis
LLQTLRDVASQRGSRDEIIVVDDSPSGSAKSAVETAGLSVRYIATGGAGLGAARNAGIAAASNDLILFCDDDVTPDIGWIEAYRDAFHANREMSAAGGPVHPIWTATPPAWIEEYLAQRGGTGVLALLDTPAADQFGRDAVFFGCNMAFRAAALRRHRFPPELVGGETVGSGDVGVLRALLAEGAVVATLRHPLVYHRIAPERLHIRYFRGWGRHLGAVLIYEQLRGRPTGLMHLFRYFLSTGLREGWRIGLGFAFWRSRHPKAIDRQLVAMSVIEKLRYIVKLRNDPVRRQAVAEAL